MTGRPVEVTVRRAIGGDAAALAWLVGQGPDTDDPLVAVVAALLRSERSWLARAAALAQSRHDRQTVAIVAAHLDGHAELVDALARDHLTDFPGSYLVAWVASGAGR